MMRVELLSITLVERHNGFNFYQPEPYGAQGTGISYESIPPFGLFGRTRGPTSAGAAKGIVLRDGPEGFVIATTDHRYEATLPDTGEGGAGLYGCIEQSGSKTPHVVIFGAGGDMDEGTVLVTCKTPSGDATIEINPSTGDMTLTHPTGTKALLKADAFYAGGEAGAFNIVVDNGALATAWAGLTSACATKGITVPPLVGYAATKAKAL